MPEYDASCNIESKKATISFQSIHDSDIFKIDLMSKEEILNLAKNLVHKIDHRYDHLKEVVSINRLMDQSIWEENMVRIFDCAKKLRDIWQK